MQTKSLEDDRNFYKHAYEQTLARLKQEQLQCQQLRADNGELRARWNGMMHRPPPPEADTKQARLPPVVKHKRLGDSHPK